MNSKQEHTTTTVDKPTQSGAGTPNTRTTEQYKSERAEWIAWLKDYGIGKFYDAFMYNAQNAEGTCVHCDEPIYLDIREGGGVTDWRTIDGDYGCDQSPESNDEACGGHTPRKGAAQ